jgi:hypothetical protein
MINKGVFLATVTDGRTDAAAKSVSMMDKTDSAAKIWNKCLNFGN